MTEGTLTAYLAFAPATISLAELAWAAGARWAIERCFQDTQSQLGLDHYEVRTWRGWYRHMTLVMAAYAFLVGRRQRVLKKNLCRLPDGLALVTVSLADLRRWFGLITTLTAPLSHRNRMLHGFHWRRRHQRIAQYDHGRRRQRKSAHFLSITLSGFLQL